MKTGTNRSVRWRGGSSTPAPRGFFLGPNGLVHGGAFARATVSSIIEGVDGLVVPILSGELGYQGYRREYNLLSDTENFSAWTASGAFGSWNGATVATNTTVAPNGTTTADTLTFISPTSARSKIISAAAGTVVNFTVYLMKGTSNDVRLVVNRGTGGVFAATLINTEISSQLSTTEFRRLSVTVTQGASTQLEFCIASNTNGGTAIAWGASANDVTGRSNQNPPEYIPVGTGGPNFSNNISNTQNFAAFSNISANMTITSNVSDPFGGTAAFTLTTSAASQFCANLITSGIPSATTQIRNRMWIRRRTGIGTVNFYNGATASGAEAVTSQVSSTWTLVETQPTAAGAVATNYIGVLLGASGDAVDVYLPEARLCLFSGFNVDGVRYFNYLNGNTVSNNVVTEAVGAAINSSNSKWGVLPGTSGSYFSTPTSSAVNLGGRASWKIRSRYTLTNSGSNQFLACRHLNSGAGRSYQLYLSSGNLPILEVSSNGTVGVSAVASTTLSTATGVDGWLEARFVLGNPNSTVSFWISQDETNWVQLGTTQSVAVTSIWDNGRALFVGADGTGGNSVGFRSFRTKIFGASDELLVDFNPNSYTSGGTWTSATGETWTPNGSASVFTGQYLWDANGPVGYQQFQAYSNLHFYSQSATSWNPYPTAADSLVAQATTIQSVIQGVTWLRNEEKATTSTHTDFNGSGFTVTANTTYCTYRYVKADQVTRVRLSLNNAMVVNGFYADFNLTTGTVTATGTFGTGTYTNSGIVQVGAGGYLIWVAGVVDAASTAVYNSLWTLDASGNSNYLGTVGRGVYWIGAQINAGAEPLPYMATTNASAPKNLDVLSFPTANIVTGVPLTVVAEVTKPTSTTAIIVDVDDGGNGGLLYLGGSTLASYGNGVVAQTSAITFPITTPKKFAVTSSGSATNLYIDGALTVGATIANYTVDPTGYIGCRNGATFPLNGWIRNVKLYQAVLTPGQLR